MYQPPYFIKKFISTNRSRVKDPHILAKKQQKMPIFEKVDYWGLKDPLEVRVQHETCIYMGDTFSSHFEPKKIDWVGRRGQKQPKLAYICTFKNTQFWLFLAPPANPVDFFWFQMAGKGVLHIVLMFYVGPAPLGGLLGPNSQLFQK